MPKKRTTEAVNPLKRDAIAAVVGELSADLPNPAVVAKEAAAAEPQRAPAPANKPKPRRGPKRRAPQQEKQGTKWTEKDHQLKGRVSGRDAELWKATIKKLGAKTGTNPAESNVLRAMVSLVMQLDEELDTMAPVPLKKPGYADKAGIAVYEDELARVIHKLLKRMPLGPE